MDLVDFPPAKDNSGEIVISETEIFEKLRELLEAKFELAPESITLQARLYEDLNLDSIDAIDLIGEVQTYLKQRIKPQDFREVRTVQDIVLVVKRIVDNPEPVQQPELRA